VRVGDDLIIRREAVGGRVSKKNEVNDTGLAPAERAFFDDDRQCLGLPTRFMIHGN
jgi:hypothetical protein